MDQWNKDILNEIEGYDLPEAKLTKNEQERILKVVQSQLGDNRDKHSKNPCRPRKQIRTILIAAAIICAFSVTVAATGMIFKMGNNEIGFFNGNDVSVMQSLRQDLENYSAQIDQSVTDKGITVTFDSLATDHNILNAFFTVTTENPIDLISPTDSYSGAEEGEPKHFLVSMAAPSFQYRVSGEGFDNNYHFAETVDSYMQDEHTIKVMVRVVPPTLFPENFTLEVFTSQALHTNGKWSYSADVDISNVMRGKTAEAQTLTFPIIGGDKKLELGKFAVTPFGISVSTRSRYKQTANSRHIEEGYTILDQLIITDDQGNVLNQRLDSILGSSNDTAYKGIELLGGSPETQSLKFTPILWKMSADAKDQFEERSIKTTEIGSKIETSDLGGFFLKNYKIEGSEVILTLTPYGYVNHIELSPNDDGVTLRNGRSGLINIRQDYKTGEVIYSISYYVATHEELEQITEFTYLKDLGCSKDNDASVTVQLK